MKGRILVVDDNPDINQALKVLFTLNDLHCRFANTPEAGLKLLESEEFDLVIQDMNFSRDTTSGAEGIQLFQKARSLIPDIPIIIITAWANLETAVELVKSGAADYVSKPWDDDKLLVTVNNLLELGDLQSHYRATAEEKQNQRDTLSAQYDLCGIQFGSNATLQLLKLATQVAHSDVPILITGPNGAGKEKIAEIVQANSSCRNGPFIKVNVGALSKDLMEAELFGAEAGAYTGITKRRIGRFELADNGTLFLDEIGTLHPEGQVKLLRVLETGEFERLGSTETIKVKVRIISATNSDLKNAIKEQTFRQDLYYRLNTIELNLKPLRERKDDIMPLVKLFTNNQYLFEENAVKLLREYEWPGNVRELKNTIKRATLLSQNNIIRISDLGLDLTRTREPMNREIDKEDIMQALEESNGTIAEAARSLGLSRSAFYRRLKKYDIDL